MLLKLRYKKTVTYEAVVDIPSGFSRAQTIALAEDQADEKDLWKPVSESDFEVEIVEEDGRIPTVRGEYDEENQAG